MTSILAELELERMREQSYFTRVDLVDATSAVVMHVIITTLGSRDRSLPTFGARICDLPRMSVGTTWRFCQQLFNTSPRFSWTVLPVI